MAQRYNPEYVNIEQGYTEAWLHVERLLYETCTTNYAASIRDSILDDVIEDIIASSHVNISHDCMDFNEDDIRLAIGRVLSKRLGVEQ